MIKHVVILKKRKKKAGIFRAFPLYSSYRLVQRADLCIFQDWKYESLGSVWKHENMV